MSVSRSLPPSRIDLLSSALLDPSSFALSSYQEFDFHHECKGMKFENVSILIDRLNDTFLKQSYFEAAGPDSHKLQSQNGAFRTK